jgi:hypothetical protein
MTESENTESEYEDRVTCGEDFCDRCGDCLACYGDDPCYDGGDHNWPSRDRVVDDAY